MSNDSQREDFDTGGRKIFGDHSTIKLLSVDSVTQIAQLQETIDQQAQEIAALTVKLIAARGAQGAYLLSKLRVIIINLIEKMDTVVTDRDVRMELVRSIGLVDSDWYLSKYKDVRDLALDPDQHYVTYGLKEGRMPNGLLSDAQ